MDSPKYVIEKYLSKPRRPPHELIVVPADSSDSSDDEATNAAAAAASVVGTVAAICEVPYDTSSVPSDDDPLSSPLKNEMWPSPPSVSGKALKRSAAAAALAEPPVAPKVMRTHCSLTPSADQRICTIPRLNFADSDEVWSLMCRQDEKWQQLRDPNMLQMHKGLHPRMRAILLDWLIEVSEVYKLRRETFYLAVDYIDRYLSNVNQFVPKNHLQLIGVTCLFIASKVEEIYPPKISEFAYITDSACNEDDILRQELVVLACLVWNMHPTTALGWAAMYMQIDCTTNLRPPEPQPLIETRKSATERSAAENKLAEAFVFPQYSAMEFTHVAQLLDLCILDVEVSNFSYSVLAAAAICHVFDA